MAAEAPCTPSVPSASSNPCGAPRTFLLGTAHPGDADLALGSDLSAFPSHRRLGPEAVPGP